MALYPADTLYPGSPNAYPDYEDRPASYEVDPTVSYVNTPIATYDVDPDWTYT